MTSSLRYVKLFPAQADDQLAKCVNYVSEYWSQFFFAFFVGVWT